MKKTGSPESAGGETEEMLPEYPFDYRKARPNRFAPETAGSRVVVLDPDVAEVFTTPEAVNAVLRALIETIPGAEDRKEPV